MESSARFAVLLLLRHGSLVAAEFSEDHHQLVGTLSQLIRTLSSV
jgi:hypothetical protein